MSDAVRVRPATADDRPAIAALLDSVLGPHPYDDRVRLWDWRTGLNPARPDGFPDFLVAESRAGIVGVHGLIPLRFQSGGDTVLSACSCDFAVAADARGAGLPLKLAAMAPSLSAVPLSTTANEAAGRLTVALKGAMLPPAAVRYLRPVRLGRFVAARLGGGPLARAAGAAASLPDWLLRAAEAIQRVRLPAAGEVVEVREFDSAFDDLWERVRAGRPVGLVRDAEYLNWRHRDYPFGGVRAFAVRRAGRVEGAGVIQIGTAPDGLRVAAVTELIADGGERDIAALLVAELIRTAVESGVDYLMAFAPTPGIEAALARARFRRREAGRSPYTWKANRADDHGLLADPARWLYSLGDGDACFFYPSHGD